MNSYENERRADELQLWMDNNAKATRPEWLLHGVAARSEMTGEKVDKYEFVCNYVAWPPNAKNNLALALDYFKSIFLDIDVKELIAAGTLPASFFTDTYGNRLPKTGTLDVVVTLVPTHFNFVVRQAFTLETLIILPDGRKYDIFDAGRDICNRVINGTSRAYDLFEEKPLAILAALYYHLKLGFRLNRGIKTSLRSSSVTQQLRRTSIPKVIEYLNAMLDIDVQKTMYLLLSRYPYVGKTILTLPGIDVCFSSRRVND